MVAKMRNHGLTLNAAPPGGTRAAVQIATCRPISTTLSTGRRKKSVT